MSEIFEIVMVLSFGVSWPFSVVRSYRSKSTKGKSPVFLCCIIFGYIAGIVSKLLNGPYMASFSQKWYVLIFYVINLLMVSADLCIYFANRRRERIGDPPAEQTALDCAD